MGVALPSISAESDAVCGIVDFGGRLSFPAPAAIAYTEKTKIEVVCREEDVQRLVDLIGTAARTGHRGDGVTFVTDAERTVEVRTGDENALALL